MSLVSTVLFITTLFPILITHRTSTLATLPRDFQAQCSVSQGFCLLFVNLNHFSDHQEAWKDKWHPPAIRKPCIVPQITWWPKMDNAFEKRHPDLFAYLELVNSS